jgi:hypothetical protein
LCSPKRGEYEIRPYTTWKAMDGRRFLTPFLLPRAREIACK